MLLVSSSFPFLLATYICTRNNFSFASLMNLLQMITFGGDAELELVDSLDPFSEGVVFSVRPPKKSWKNIANLSGGDLNIVDLTPFYLCI
jgi:hypothetical protein